MRLSDTLSGTLFLALGLVLLLAGWRLPTPPFQAVGPGFFPMVVGGVMAVFGAGVALAGLRREGLTDLLRFDAWVVQPRHLVAVLAVPVAIAAYPLLAPLVGFLAASVATMLVLAFAWRDKPGPALLLAVGTSFALYAFFGWGLRVPLPFGPLEQVLTWRS